MRKILLLTCLSVLALTAQAYTVDTTASYIYSSDYNQARLGAAVPLGINFSIGLEGKYVEDKFSIEQGAFKDPVYSVYLPMQMDFELFRLNLTPFYYFKNDFEKQPHLKDAYAYGVSSQFIMDLVKDEVDELYSQAYVGVSYARQKANTFDESGTQWNHDNYDQLVFSLGLRQNFYDAFMFQVAGAAFQYPDGVSRIEAFRGILDMKDLAFTESFDVTRSLTKYALSARITRMWAEQRSSLYAAYHYAESYTADSEHSVIVGNTFLVAKRAHVDIAFNHLQDTHGDNKRDLFYVNLNIAF